MNTALITFPLTKITNLVNEDTTSQYNLAMEKLLVVVQELSLARSLEDVMAIVRVAARQLTGADGATFVLRDKDQCFYADEDAIAPLWKGLRFPMSICISGWTMLNRQPTVIPDIYEDARIPHAAYQPTFVKSLAMVPIRTIDLLRNSQAIANLSSKKVHNYKYQQ
ncbi:GAF domain-containing protein, partial [Microcoleus sp. S28C3]|uniref:GAF domain-containing protein n=1 Tax=Microcoleus sp. S28C3 TaxID=3055414 RepID=UPI002FD3A7C9